MIDPELVMKFVNGEVIRYMEEDSMTTRQMLEEIIKREGYMNAGKKVLDNMDVASHYPVNHITNLVDRRLEIEKVIFNPPATIILWADKTKTVVKCQGGEPFDPEKGMTMAFMKKALGNSGKYFKEIDKWCKPYYEMETIEKHPDLLAGMEIVKGISDSIKTANERLSRLRKVIADMSINEQSGDMDDK